MILRRRNGYRIGVRWTGFLIVSLLLAPLTVLSATPTPPVGPGSFTPPGAQNGQPYQPYFPGGQQGQPFYPGGQTGAPFGPGGQPGQPFFPQGGPGPQGAGAPPGTRISASSPSQAIPFSISLKIQDQKVLDAFLKDLYNPTSPNYLHFITPQDFTKRFISSTGRQQVTDSLKNANMTVVDHGIGSVIAASGRVDAIQTMFKVTMSDYQDGSGGTYAATDMTPTIPPTLQPYIQSVIGLDNAIEVKSHMVVSTEPTDVPLNDTQTPTAQGCDAALTIAKQFGAYTPNQLATAYNFNEYYAKGEQGQGQIIALMAVGDFHDQNIATYQSCFGTNVKVTRAQIDGGSQPGPFAAEVELDTEVLTSLLPKLQQLLVYESDYRITAIINAFQAAANDNVASVVSISFGSCEATRTLQSFILPENTIFQQMAAQGQSVFAASGDSGSRDCSGRQTPGGSPLAVDDPASQPYVTGVGGTKLTIDPTTNAYMSETVWNGIDSNGGGAGGGGLSSIWSAPDYQTGPGTASKYATGKRQVPDVSASADPKSGFITYTTDPQSCARVPGSFGGSCFMATGGTSVAAPIWAAAVTLTNQRLTNNGYPRIGFANPLIYRLAQSNSVIFHDITTGHNCADPSCTSQPDPLYPATVGYDMATGIGTFDAGAFGNAAIASLPHITGTAPMSGPDSGGTTVTFNGTNFQQFVSITFGGVLATNVKVVDDKTITVVTPPHPAGAVDIELTTGGTHFTLSGGYSYVKATPPSPSPSPPTSTAPTSTATPRP